MFNILRKLWRGSIETRVIRACLFSSVKGRQLYELMRNDKEVWTMIEEDEEEEDEDQTGERRNQNVNHASNNGANSIVTGNVGTSGEGGEEVNEEGRAKRRRSESRHKFLSGGFRLAQLKSRTDCLALVTTGGLKTQQIRRRNFSDDVIVRMMSFLFRANNVVLLSWGTKRVFYCGQYHIFPAVIRRTSAEALWRRYIEELGIGLKVRHVGRTVLRKNVPYLTKGQLEARSCIDYYQDALVNENTSLLKEILKMETDPNSDHYNLER